MLHKGVKYSIRFQSTLPGWGATRIIVIPQDKFDIFQSTLPGWGATIYAVRRRNKKTKISIHAPRMGSDFLDLDMPLV